MKNFLKKMGTAVIAGAIFGIVAGVIFQGIHIGSGYLSEKFGDWLPDSVVAEYQKDQDNTETSTTSISEKVLGNAIDTKETETLNQTNAKSTVYDVSQVAENVMPSIVSITSTTVYENPYAYFYGQEQSQEVEGSGSGILIGEDDNNYYIATNYHVVEAANKLMVGFIDDTSVEATIKGYDSQSDLAIACVDKSKISKDTINQIAIATLGDSKTMKVGEPVVAIGNALGYGQSVTVGYVSALNREVQIEDKTLYLLQTDAAINPGNSGGALLNIKGEVIGINSVKNISSNVEGMGYAIPISDAVPILDEIIKSDEQDAGDIATQAYMGIQGKDISAADAQAFGMEQGIYIMQVLEGAPAVQAGLQAGDIITGIDDIDVTSMSELKAQLAKHAVGDQVVIQIQRQNKRGEYSNKNITVTLGKAE